MNISIQDVGTHTRSTGWKILAQRVGSLDVIILLLWPLVLLGINHNWLFLNTVNDDWMYFGYFNNLQEHLQRYPATDFYNSTRLPWILLGYLCYSLLPPIAANYTLHLGTYYAATFSMYVTLAATVNRRAALLTTMLLGSYSYFLIAVGADYVNSAGIAYFCVSLLCIVLAWKSRFRLFFLGLAGAMAAATIYSNLFYVSLFPGLAVVYIGLHRPRQIKLIIRHINATAIGALAATGLFGVVNMVLGGEFYFFRMSVQFASFTTQLPKNLWIETPIDWPIRNPHLIYPILVFGISAACLIISPLRRRLRTYPVAPALLVQFLVTIGIMFAFQLRPSTPVLQAYFYAGCIIPSTFLALGALIALPIQQLSTRTFVITAMALAVCEVGAFAFRSCWAWSMQDSTLAVLALGLIWAIVLLGLYLFARAWFHTLFITSFCALIIAVPSAFNLFSSYHSFCLADPKAQQPLDENYQAVLKGVGAIKRIAPNSQPFFWYDVQEQQFYHSLSAFYLGPWAQVSEQFPSFGQAEGRTSVGNTVVLLSRRPDQLDLAQTVLHPKGRTAKLLGQELVQEGHIEFYMTIFLVEALPDGGT